MLAKIKKVEYMQKNIFLSLSYSTKRMVTHANPQCKGLQCFYWLLYFINTILDALHHTIRNLQFEIVLLKESNQ